MAYWRSFFFEKPLSRAALGPPAQAVRSGARIGSGVQKVGNGASGTWKNATSGARFSQKGEWNRIATRITGPEASLPSAAVFALRAGEKRTAPDCRTPSGNVTTARRAWNANERPFTTTLPRFQVRVVT